jgi:hypothetical protein
MWFPGKSYVSHQKSKDESLDDSVTAKKSAGIHSLAVLRKACPGEVPREVWSLLQSLSLKVAATLTASLGGTTWTGIKCQGCRGPWPKRAQGRNEQMRHMKGLTHSEREWQNTYQEGQKVDDQLAKFDFSRQVLYKRGRDLNIKKHSDLVTTFLFLPPCILTASVLD